MLPPSPPIWKKAPVLRVLVPFAAGIAMQPFTFHPEWTGWVLLILAGCTLGWTTARIGRLYTCYHIAGAVILLMAFSAGLLIATVKNPYRNARIIEPWITEDTRYEATILETPVERKKSWRALASLDKLRKDGRTIEGRTLLFLYFRKGHDPPGIGSTLTFHQSPRTINQFPGSVFDYPRYCALKNIHHQVWLKSTDYQIIAIHQAHPVSAFTDAARQRIIGITRKYLKDPGERGLAMALLIGYRDELDHDLSTRYAATGTIHIIAISGLHLGLIYSIIRYGCGLILPLAGRTVIRSVLVILALWMFTLMAGAGPSVVRSAVMFTAIALGEMTTRTTNLYNNLFASALLLLAWNPSWMYDLGFLLSYTALLGIAVYARPLSALYQPAGRLPASIWKMQAVTISAQLLTLPVLLCCFQQFPVYFLPANAFAVPVSSLLLIAGILLCVFSGWTGISELLAGGLSAGIRIMNAWIDLLSNLPFNTVRIGINLPQACCLYLIIAMLSGWLMTKNRMYVPAAIVAALIFRLAAW